MGFFNKDLDEAEQTDELQEELRDEAQASAEEDFHEEVELIADEGSSQQERENAAEERRELRRQRRKRNELLATMAALLAVVVLSGTVFAGVRAIRQFMDSASSESVATETTENIQDIVQDILASESALPTEVEDVVTVEELLEEYIDTVIAGMTLEEKVAGLIITSPEGLTGVARATRAGDGTKTAREAMPVGGLGRRGLS